MTRTRLGRTWRWVSVALTIGLAGRTAWLFVSYLTGRGAARHHVESSAVAFILVGAIAAFFNREDRAESRAPSAYPGTHHGWRLLLWCVASYALYSPVLGIGFLSDDYVLAHRALEGQFGVVHTQLFRPLPLIVWSLVLHAGGGPAVLHAVNILCHGVVAFLTSRVASAYVGPWLAAMAGLLMLTFPGHVEAVAWTSGVFDVTATALTLAAVLIARQPKPSGATRLSLCVVALAALLCKETAIVAPFLILLDQWALGRLSRRTLGDVVAIIAVFAAVGAFRFSVAPPLVDQTLSRYLAQRWLFGTVGALVVPWHADVAARWVLVPIVEAVVIVGLVAAFAASRVPIRAIRASAGFAAWTLLGTLPTLTLFFVSADLEGARYVYMATVGYVVLCVQVASTLPVFGRFAAVSALMLLITSGIGGVRFHLRPWREAAATRDAFLTALRSDPRRYTCRAIWIVKPPDSVKGAYVFRNGVAEAAEPDGVTLSPDAPPGCVLHWQPERREFAP